MPSGGLPVYLPAVDFADREWDGSTRLVPPPLNTLSNALVPAAKMKIRVLPPWRRSASISRVPFAERLRRRLLFALKTLAVLLGLAAVGAAAWVSHKQFNESRFFEIDQIDVAGASPEVEKQVREILHDLRDSGADNLLLLQTKRARARLEAIPRVRHAVVLKHFPRTLAVRIEERRPLVATNSGGFFWMDEDGVLIGHTTAREVAQARAPLLTGLRAAHFSPGLRIEQPMLWETLQAIRAMKENDPVMLQRFAEWHLTPADEVVGVLRQGAEVRFGEHDPLTRLAALGSVLRQKPELEHSQYLDLRFEEQLVHF